MEIFSTVPNWQGLQLVRGPRLLSTTREQEVKTPLKAELLVVSSPQFCGRPKSKRLRWTYDSHQLGTGQRQSGVMIQPRLVYRWPFAFLSSKGDLWSKSSFGRDVSQFSNSSVSLDKRLVHKLQFSKNDSSINSCVSAKDEEESCWPGCPDFVPVEFDEKGRLGDEAGKDVSLDKKLQIAETVFGDGARSPNTVQPNGATRLISSIVRTLSGASVREQVSIMQHENAEKRKLKWNPLRLLYETDPSPAAPWAKRFAAGWARAETDFFAFSRQLGKYVFIMSGLGTIMVAGLEMGGGSPHEQGVLGFSWLAGVVIGSMIGAGQVLKEHAMAGCRNVIITGSTRGLGKALAREFLRHGDNVVITSRSSESVSNTVEELRKETQEYSSTLSPWDAKMELFGLPSPKRKGPKVIGIACDVSKSDDVRVLADYAVKEFGTVDLWVNNAGVNKGFRPLLEFSGEELEQIVSTNLVGSMICTREAIKLMQTQKKGGHIFNMDGAGSGGSSTPLTAGYGATKCGLRQLNASLLQEVKGTRVGIHTASPGMVLTDLLLSGASLQNKKMFNFICEQPETVARALVPNLRLVNGTGKAVNYLTPARIIFAIVSLWIRRGRWFDEEGRAVYAAEAERLRLWAEGRERSPVTAAMELVPSGTWVSIFSSSIICAYLILASSSNGNLPGI